MVAKVAGIYRRRITAASSREIARYISEDTMARMVIPVITIFILKICIHLENLRAVLDEIAEPQIGRLKLADDDTYQRQPRIDLERGHQGRHAAGQHDLSQNLSLGGAERLRQLDLVGIDALETRVDHQDGDEHGNCKRHAVDRQGGAEPDVEDR